MSPPPQLCYPFQRVKQLSLTQHPNDSMASTATLTSLTSAATKLHFTEDSESYFRTDSPTPLSPLNSPGAEKTRSPGRFFTWGRRDTGNSSVTTLVSSDENGDQWKADAVAAATPEEKYDTGPRLAALRKKMAEEEIDYFIIPTEDGHLSEYTAPSDRRRQWISGFTGSAGTAIVSKNSAYLFTDARYWAQAERQLDRRYWQLQKVGWAPSSGPSTSKGGSGSRDWLEWAVTCPRGSKIGIDSRMISHEKASQLYKGLYDRGSKLAHPRQNLVDLVWDDRPKRPKDPIFTQPIEFTGKGAKEKLSEIRRWIRTQNIAYNKAAALANAPKGVERHNSTASGKPSINRSGSSASNTKTLTGSIRGSATKSPLGTPTGTTETAATANSGEKISALFVSNLASIAHTLNLRGSDIPYNPVFTAYLIIALDRTLLFVDSGKLSKELKAELAENGVSVREYSEVWAHLRSKAWGDGKIIVHPNTPYAVTLIIGSHRYVVLPSTFLDSKLSIKNSAEIAGFREAYQRDGAAWVRWMAWMDKKFHHGYELTEWEAQEKLEDFRRTGGDNLYVGPAYEPIIASGENAALPHYTATKTGARIIDRDTPLLVDSGGQYRDGTTDTSRTVHFGYPDPEQTEAFTRVLQGHIAIDTAVFPKGTTGAQLDVLARKALWRDGLNYLHGTGHGFGSFLNVHEGPHSFSSDAPLEPGHVLTNEPGFYKEGEFGVRIESALLVKKVETKGQFGGDVWLGFERFTQVPIQMRMVKASLLSKEERQWIKDHNASVKKALEPLLQNDKKALKWLRRECGRDFYHEGKATPGFSIEWD